MNLKCELVIDSQQDLNQIKKIFSEVSQSIARKAFFNWSQENIESELRLSHFCVLKNKVDEIVSFISFRSSSELIEIMAMATAVKQSSQGHMTKLLRSFVEHYSKFDNHIQLEVHEENQIAINIYTKCGFRKLRVRKNYYADQGDAILMGYLKEML